MARNKFTSKQKLDIVKEYLSGNTSFMKLGNKYGIDESSIRQWLAKYKSFGDEAFEFGSTNENYSAEFKKKVVTAYLNGEGSYRDLAIKYKIHADSTILKWVSQYNNHVELTDSKTEGAYNMVNIEGRKTTCEERISIVEYCIENQNNYAGTALKYQVSYQQVYQWVRKFKEKGIDGLQDNRGRTKPIDEMTELEKLRSENRLLQAENKRMELENEFLKKLDEIEGRRF
jgi:transposase